MDKNLEKLVTPYLSFMPLAGYVGSISHGVYDKETGIDDKDVMCIYVPPIENLLGLHEFNKKETKVIMEGEYDITIYSVKKMFKMLLKGNPNVLGLLWLRDTDYIMKNVLGEELIKNREIFSSKLAYKSFTGYAHGQLHKMTHGANLGYMGEKRRKLVEKFGYDCKNASHLIRLLKMGAEFMVTGELNVFRHDNNMLLGIKRGEWTLEQVKLEANRMFKKAEDCYLNSKLPNLPDEKKAEELLIEIHKAYLHPFMPKITITNKF